MSIQVLSLAAAMAESAKADLLTTTTTTTTFTGTTLPSSNHPKQCSVGGSVGGVDRIVLPTLGRTGTLSSYKRKKDVPNAARTVSTRNNNDNNLFPHPTSRTSLRPESTRKAESDGNGNGNLSANPPREMSGIVSHLRNAAHPSSNVSRSLYNGNNHTLDSLVRAKASSLLSAALSQQQQQQQHHHSNAMSLHALQRAYGMKWTTGTGTGTGTGYPSHSQMHKTRLEQQRDYASPSCSSLHAAVASLFLPPRTQVQTLPSPLLLAAASLAVRNRYHLGSAKSETDAGASPPPTPTLSRSPRIWDKNAMADRSPRSPDGDSKGPTNRSTAPASSAFSSSSFAKHRPKVLFMECDEESLSEYQCLIRQQMELFEATADNATSNVQGRNKQILVGQVGIRCRHCCSGPATDATGGNDHNNNNRNHHHRSKGNMYFPTKLDRVYQAAQNLSAFHLCGPCSRIPPDIRKRIQLLRERKSPAGGGKRYWAESVRCLGVVEAKDGTGLRFA